MSKHTPGPWRVNGRWVQALKSKTVADVPEYGVIHGKVDAANARLIAAAPDLLAALLTARDQFAALDRCYVFTVGDEETTALVMVKLEAAIAKAEGK